MRVVNQRASYEYRFLEKFETGIALTGAEVKSVKAGKMSLREGFVRVREGEAWLHNVYINPYSFADNRSYDPRRRRKLLLHKNELFKLEQQTREGGLTVVPVSCYTKGNKIKLEVALARGKKRYEKREAKKRKDLEREVEQELRHQGT